ncbi:hypothetical protein V5799_013532 [Amblyomma americanum]|uniref:Uncharacterized protein n=1 Tax=Amblyomma americanum TaxID=6943 RepID=A0AAQ4E5P3_AMBAM
MGFCAMLYPLCTCRRFSLNVYQVTESYYVIGAVVLHVVSGRASQTGIYTFSVIGAVVLHVVSGRASQTGIYTFNQRVYQTNERCLVLCNSRDFQHS